MLADKELFDYVESELKKRGIIDDFEKENGKIRGRMMITQIDLPEELNIEVPEGVRPLAFMGTFDFYDCAVGIAIDWNTLEPFSGLWITPQADDAQEPNEHWIEFFLKTLLGNFKEDGSYGVPMYTFATDCSDFTVVPISPDDEEDE